MCVKILVNKQLDGYNFCMLPSDRTVVKNMFPDSYPATNIFVSYDTTSNFDKNYSNLEFSIYPALLGITDKNKLRELENIQFVETQSGQVIHTITL